jgi:hypothetical protein
LDEVPEQRAKVEVSAREVLVDERPEEVVVVVPRVAEDARLVDHAGVDEVLEEWARRGEVLEEEWVQHGGRCGAERDGGAGRIAAGARCVEATSEASGVFCRWGLCHGVDMEESIKRSKLIADRPDSLRSPRKEAHQDAHTRIDTLIIAFAK